MATYKEIQTWIRHKYGWRPETCWIAHCKQIEGWPLKTAWNWDGKRQVPCPINKQQAIFDAFRHFGMVCRYRTVGLPTPLVHQGAQAAESNVEQRVHIASLLSHKVGEK